jgi:hypothetical protein
MNFDEPLAQIYNDDQFKLMYLSLTNTPNSSKDWGFVDRHEHSLIEISGGRRRSTDLESTTVRTVSKQTLAKPLFAGLSKELKAICRKGVTLNGTPYPKILYDPSATKHRWWLNLDSKAIEAKPHSLSG